MHERWRDNRFEVFVIESRIDREVEGFGGI